MANLIKRFENTDHASSYSKYRPSYENSGLVETILKYLCAGISQKERLKSAIDVGCGQGQIIGKLVEHFETILGVDVSEAQIEQAQKTNTQSNVQYKVSTAEDLPVEDNSVDLITVGMALHWFDHPKYYKEVDRVLRPGGVVSAVMQSFYITIIDHPKQEELTDIVAQLVTRILNQGYWHERDNLIIDKYTAPELQIPYSDRIRNEDLCIKIEATIGDMFRYLETRSGVYNFLNDKNTTDNIQVWNEAIQRFADTYGTGSTESTVTYKLDLVLLMGRKPEDSNIDV